MRDTTNPFVTRGDTAKTQCVTSKAQQLRAFTATRDTRDTDMGVDTYRARIGAYVQNRVTECHVSRPDNTHRQEIHG